jgi:metal-responsive CopG/Arc/MetJ family transcriptional regulator
VTQRGSLSDVREKVAIRLSPDGLAEVDRLAEAEHRTRSDMIRVLLIEAVQARRKLAPPR